MCLILEICMFIYQQQNQVSKFVYFSSTFKSTVKFSCTITLGDWNIIQENPGQNLQTSLPGNMHITEGGKYPHNKFFMSVIVGFYSTYLCMRMCVHVYTYVCAYVILCSLVFFTLLFCYALMFGLNGFFKIYIQKCLPLENSFFQAESMLAMIAP